MTSLRTKLIRGIDELDIKIDDYINRLRVLLSLKGYSDITWNSICSLRCKIKRLVIVRTAYKRASLRDTNIITNKPNSYVPVKKSGEEHKIQPSRFHPGFRIYQRGVNFV
jgi:hypothetical protein